MITRIGFKRRFSPKHLLAPVVCLLAGLIFAREFEGLSGFKLAGVQLAACAMGCVMFMIPAMFNWVNVPLGKFIRFLKAYRHGPRHRE